MKTKPTRNANLNDLDYAIQQHGGGKSREEKESKSVLETVLIAATVLIVLAYYIILFFGKFFFEPDNMFYLSLNIFSDIANPIKPIRVISFIILILSLSKLVKFILSLVAKSETLTRKTGVAIIELISSIISYCAIFVLIFLVLDALGVNTAELVAGLGILALIIGLGAQNMVQDFVAGFFIIVEHLFDVGDIIAVNGFRGKVKSIGLRSTLIEDTGGNVMIIRNSSIGSMINLTDMLSVANCEMNLGDSGKLVEAEEIMERELPSIKKNIPDLLEGPFYIGVSNNGGNGVTMNFVAKCAEGSKYRVERALKRELILLFNEKGL